MAVIKEHDYAKVLPFNEELKSIDQFGWKPFSITKPTTESKQKWKEIIQKG